jgi:DNA-binding NarL/FixJ family response regulator
MQRTDNLSVRETQVVKLLLQGCANSDIAQELHVSERVVKAHFQQLFRRFAISDGVKRVKLATMFYRRQSCPSPNPIGASLPSSRKD